MANIPTTYFGFPKPEKGDYGDAWVDDFAAKMDAADEKLLRPYAILQNRQSSGTAGGGSESGGWKIYPFNTEQEDANTICDSTALPSFTLAAGTYIFDAEVIFYSVAGTYGLCKLRLYNITDATADIIGFTSFVQYGIIAKLTGTVTIVGSKQFRLEYQVGTSQAVNGLGPPATWGDEVYGQLIITKIA